MWVNKYKAYLDVKCTECGGELSAELEEITVGSNNQTVVVAPCDCILKDYQEQIDSLTEELEDMQREYNNRSSNGT